MAERPEFLDLLDRNPERAGESFCAFVRDFFRMCPPSVFFAVRRDDREDVIQEITVHFLDENFRRLRMYRDQGFAFEAWFTICVRYWILDWLDRNKSGKTEIPFADLLPADDDDGRVLDFPLPAVGRYWQGDERDWGEWVRIVRRCMPRLNAKCRILIIFASQGYQPREIARLVGYGPGGNVTVANDTRWCRKRLRELVLKESGISKLPF